VNDASWISTDDLTDQLTRNEVTVIDARSAERYLGQNEPIDPVAGHIPGAVNLFLGDNLEEGVYADDATLKQRFAKVVEHAGGAENIVHSCGSGVSAVHNLIAMEKAGFPGSKLYVGSWSEWIRDPQRPIATEASTGTA
jgi:thiosulfate/3-mercaptopyruvate sulfurtransferase